MSRLTRATARLCAAASASAASCAMEESRPVLIVRADWPIGIAMRHVAIIQRFRERGPELPWGQTGRCYSPTMARKTMHASARNTPSAPSDTIAVILVAGRAQRLAPLTDRTHKALLPVGGRPILAWMLEALHAAGVRRSVLVVGHCADRVRAEAARAPEGMAIEFLHNPDYAKGSALSLYAARDVLRGPTLIMDADVVFPREFLFRLLRSPEPNAFLIDEEFQDTGEEVKIYVQDGRVIALGKKVVPEAWDLVGEGIGFLKCGPEAGRVLITLLEHVIAESDGAWEYEDALHLLVKQQRVAALRIGGLPWTEVDFAVDLQRARTDVFPRIARLDDPGAS
jgi:choline kinase